MQGLWNSTYRPTTYTKATSANSRRCTSTKTTLNTSRPTWNLSNPEAQLCKNTNRWFANPTFWNMTCVNNNWSAWSGWWHCTTGKSTAYWPTKWAWARPCRLCRCWHTWRAHRASGARTWSWCRPPSWTSGRWKSKSGVRPSKLSTSRAASRSARPSGWAGPNPTLCTSSSPVTNWFCRITRYSNATGSSTWYSTRHTILRTSSRNGGHACCPSRSNAGCCLPGPRCKTTWWSCGVWCTSWCLRSSSRTRTSRTGSVYPWIRLSRTTLYHNSTTCNSPTPSTACTRYSGHSCCAGWNSKSRNNYPPRKNTLCPLDFRAGKGFYRMNSYTVTQLKGI